MKLLIQRKGSIVHKPKNSKKVRTNLQTILDDLTEASKKYPFAPWRRGVEAYLADEDLNKNPYKNDDVSYQEWESGWHMAKDRDKAGQ